MSGIKQYVVVLFIIILPLCLYFAFSNFFSASLGFLLASWVLGQSLTFLSLVSVVTVLLGSSSKFWSWRRQLLVIILDYSVYIVRILISRD